MSVIPEILDTYFNSHAHVERDEPYHRRRLPAADFNSHAHVERDGYPINPVYEKMDFNSHAHVERDVRKIFAAVKNHISTHTLTWSVTFDVVYIWCLLNVMRTYFFI